MKNPKIETPEPKAPKNLPSSEELLNDLQRTRADFENFRKQIELQKENERSAARLSTVYKFLPLLDDIDRAINAYKELEPLKKTLEKTLTSLNLEKIQAGPGIEFNPDFHNAVLVEEAEENEGKETIAEVLQPGYLYEGKVLRPAMVKVKK